MNTQIEELRDSILEHRICGEVTFQVAERIAAIDDNSSAKDILDSFVKTSGFAGLGDHWTEIDRDNAQTIAQNILRQDLAYRAEIMPEQLACQLAGQFLALFDDGTHYFTNGEFDDRGLLMWSGITEATFDSGIICIDNQRIGILWVQDEA